LSRPRDRGLVDIATADLEILAEATAKGRFETLDGAALQGLALGHLSGRLGPLDGCPARLASSILRAVLAERRHRPRPHLELVWTGPEAGLRPARDTAVVVGELFARARQRVLVGGFRFDHGADILRPLHQMMRQHGVQASLFLDVSRAPHGEDPEHHAAGEIGAFLAHNWPFGEPRPNIYHDPRTSTHRAMASLHAKCVVVDGRWSLVSSANFTDRGLRRNLEAGVLIDDPTFASRLSEQWLAMVESGQMRPYRP
jgi:phosphatidylserine/phosphatidylglycerophosphate/cardiolipin synthase-like enzyme